MCVFDCVFKCLCVCVCVSWTEREIERKERNRLTENKGDGERFGVGMP